MIRCSECHKDILDETKALSWYRLTNFVEFMVYEEYINEETYKVMMDCLQDFKEFALSKAQ